MLHTGARRNLEHNGTRTASAHLPERFEHGVRDFPGPERESLPLGYGAHRVRLVGDFVNCSHVLADCAARDLARNEQYGRGARVCVGQTGRGVVETGTRHHQRHPPGFPDARA